MTDRSASQPICRFVFRAEVLACVLGLLLLGSSPVWGQDQAADWQESAAAKLVSGVDARASYVQSSLGEEVVDEEAHLSEIISLQVKGVTLEEALQSIAEKGDLELVYGSHSVLSEKRVTLNLQQVTAQEALREVTQGTGLKPVLSPSGRFVLVSEATATGSRRLKARSTDFKIKPVKIQAIEGAPLHSQNQQQGTITGTVTDSLSGESIPGVNVVIAGTQQGSATDANGEYTISGIEPGTYALRASYVGYSAKTVEGVEVQEGQTTQVDFQLVESAIALEEVVAVGYGEQTERSLTNAVSSVSGESISTQDMGDLRETLQGRVPGLTIVDQGGRPGDRSMNVNIRGITSTNNSNPLILVDGVEVPSLADIDPNSVESVSVLKDAASTAIYGSRGANGIIVVTTKKGGEGWSVTYDGYVGLQTPTILPEMIDTEGFMRLQNDIFANSNDPTWPHFSEEEIQSYLRAMEENPAENPPVHYDWDDVLVDAPQTDHSLTLMGGGNVVQSMVSLAYSARKGQYPNRNFERYQLRSNNSINILEDIVTAHTNLYLKRGDRYSPASGAQPEYFTVQGMIPPSTPFAGRVYNEDGTYNTSARFNPHFLSDPDYQGLENIINDAATIDIGGEVEPIEGLGYDASLSVQFRQNQVSNNTPQYTLYGNQPGQEDEIWQQSRRNALEEDGWQSLRTTFRQVISYENNYSNHNISGLVGHSEDEFKREGNYVYAQDFYNNELRDLSQSTVDSREIDNSSVEWGLRSFFSRLQYNFDDKYLIELSGRLDGSSRFPEGSRYSFFPSGSAGWRLSEESFWAPLESVIEEFKLRYSYGVAGNQNVSPYSYIPQLQVTNPYTFADESGSEEPVTGVIQNRLASTELSWETTTQHNIGLDISTLSGRLGLNFDVFRKVTDNILLNVPVPSVVGLNPSSTNAGEITNQGWELNTSWDHQVKGLQYGVQVGVSSVVDEITDFGGLGRTFLQFGGKNAYGREQGSPVFAIFGYEALGYFQDQEEIDNSAVWGSRDEVEPGEVKYRDVNGDGVINPDGDYLVIGDLTPQYTFSMNLDVAWNNFDLTTFWQGTAGSETLIGGYRAEHGIYGNSSVLKLVEGNYWQEPGDTDVRFPRPQVRATENTQPSTHWLVDASYLRLKSLRLGYTLPDGFTNNLPVGGVTVYLRGTNLLTFSALNKWGIDPEGVPVGANEFRGVPNHSLRHIFPTQVRTYNVGMQLQF